MSPEPTMNLLREGRVRSRSRTSRRDSPAAPRVGFLDTPGEGCLRASEQPQGTTPFSFSRTNTRAPGKITPGTPREWSAVGERIATTPAGPQAQELSPIAPVGLQTPADRPACMQPTPARPLYQVAEGKVTFKDPWPPPCAAGIRASPVHRADGLLHPSHEAGRGERPDGTYPLSQDRRGPGGDAASQASPGKTVGVGYTRCTSPP